MEQDWLLQQGETVLGRLAYDEQAPPFVYYRFEPTEAFEAFRPLFDEFERLSDLAEEDPDAAQEMERTLERIQALGLSLHAADSGERIDNPTLGIDSENGVAALTMPEDDE